MIAPEFSEWMVNAALSRYLKGSREDAVRFQWFFNLPAKSPRGTTTVSDLGGFEWSTGEVFYQAEKALIPRHDRGNIPPERFRLQFRAVRPDFRFWTRDKAQQLIVENKRTSCSEWRHLAQAKKYFEYLQEFPSTGAVVYLVAHDPDGWLSLLNKAAGGAEICIGVLEWTESFLQRLGSDLVNVIEESLTQSQAILARARELANGGQIGGR